MKRHNPAPKTRRRSKPKRPSCTVRGCTRRPYIGGEYCITHGKRLADSLFAAFIVHRDGCCQKCGTTSYLQCSHHISRGRLATRYDPENAVAHCRGCHKTFTENPPLHLEWIIDRMGADEYELLLDRAYGPRDENGVRHQTDANRPDYASLIALYREDAA